MSEHIPELYLAGPMTGHPGYNALAFETAAERLRSLGFSVTTPFDIQNVEWQEEHGRDFDPWSDELKYGDPALRWVWVRNIEHLLIEADGIALLNGWATSSGAQIERRIARLHGVPIYSEDGTLLWKGRTHATG